jgi:hypothetical protein
MTSIRTLVSVSALFVAFAGVHVADAQTAKQARLVSAKPASALSWACQTKIVEIAPVSEDTSGRHGWVMVHRVNGEIIAAERVSASEVEQIRRLPCQGDRLAAPPPLVG